MHGKAKHLTSYRGEITFSMLRISGCSLRSSCQAERTELAEQGFGSFHSLGVRLIEPSEVGGSANAERMEKEDDFREIRSLDLRCVAVGSVEVSALRPEPPTGAWGGASGPPFALISGGAADRFEVECADATFGIVPSYSSEAGVHHMTDAIDGDGGFGDVRGDDHLAERVGGEGEILFLGGQLTMQGNQCHPLRKTLAADRVHRGHDFSHARHEDQDIAIGAGLDDAFYCVRGLLRDRTIIRTIEIRNLDRPRLAFGDDYRTSVKIGSDGFRIERGRHHSDLEIRAGSRLKLLGESQ